MVVRYNCQIHNAGTDPVMRRDLLVSLVDGFPENESQKEKIKYIQRINGNPEITRALKIFGWFHTTQQDILYGKTNAKNLREYRKSLKDERSHRNNGNK